MAVFTALTRCADLTPEIAKLAARSGTDIRALLERFSEIARPGEGCPKILLALARLVDQPWLEGRLRVEISGDDDATVLDVFGEHGAGILERLLPKARFAVPFDEFSRAIELAPEIVLPLRVTDEEAKLILTPLLTPEEALHADVPAFELEEKSLGDAERTTAPPPGDLLADTAALFADAPGAAPAYGERPPSQPPTQPPPTPPVLTPPVLTPPVVTPLVTHVSDGAFASTAAAGSTASTVPPSVHNRPTVPKMAAVDPEAIRRAESQRGASSPTAPSPALPASPASPASPPSQVAGNGTAGASAPAAPPPPPSSRRGIGGIEELQGDAPRRRVDPRREPD
jgi:hypothetical protein